MKYYALKNFKSGGKVFKAGQEFVGKQAELLLASGLIEATEVVKGSAEPSQEPVAQPVVAKAVKGKSKKADKAVEA